jgi:hypothetical protein
MSSIQFDALAYLVVNDIGDNGESPVMVISRRSEGLTIRSTLPPKANIAGGKFHRSLKADIND